MEAPPAVWERVQLHYERTEYVPQSFISRIKIAAVIAAAVLVFAVVNTVSSHKDYYISFSVIEGVSSSSDFLKSQHNSLRSREAMSGAQVNGLESVYGDETQLLAKNYFEGDSRSSGQLCEVLCGELEVCEHCAAPICGFCTALYGDTLSRLKGTTGGYVMESVLLVKLADQISCISGEW